MPVYNPTKTNGFMFSKYSRGVDKDQFAVFHRNLSESEIGDIMANGVDTSSGKEADPNNPDNDIPIDSAFDPSSIQQMGEQTNTVFEDRISIKPNPANPVIHISIYLKENIKVRLYSLDGKLVRSWNRKWFC